MTLSKSKAKRIGIIGAGFSGVSLAANLHRLMETSTLQKEARLEVYLFEKTGEFALGDAYRTPYLYHLLNVRAENMSAFENDATHFVRWIHHQQKTLIDESVKNYLDPLKPLADQFVPRLWYGQYLKHLLKTMVDDQAETFELNLESGKVIDVVSDDHQPKVILQNGQSIELDYVVFALGNLAPAQFPFSVEKVKVIANPWDYVAPRQIQSDESVLIIGTGLSMIDVVLTLHHQNHQGKIYALSRHGLMPLPHGEGEPPHYELGKDIATNMRTLTKQLRLNIKNHHNEGGDWRSVINAYRTEIPKLWSKISLGDKQKFLRHVLPYWNIHRHRVYHKIDHLLAEKLNQQQLSLLHGRVLGVKNNMATIRIRKTHEIKQIKTDWIINCMGPSLNTTLTQDSLISSLLKRGMISIDPLKLGFITNQQGALQNPRGEISSQFYALGPITKGMIWESTAVPGIRKQSLLLARHLLSEAFINATT